MGIWSKAKTVLLGAVIALGGASFLAFGGETPLVADAATVPGNFVKVTSLDSLEDGDTLIFAYDGFVMGAQGKNIRTAVSAGSISSNTESLESVDDSWAQVMIKGDNTSGFTIQDVTTSQYFCLNSSDSKLHETDNADDADTWIFSEKSSGKYHAQSSSYSNRYLEFNTNKDQQRWACYKNSMGGFYIFEKVVADTFVENIDVTPASVDVKHNNVITASAFTVTSASEAYANYRAEIGTKDGDSFTKRADVTFEETVYSYGDNCLRFYALDPVSAEQPDVYAYADVTLNVTYEDATEITITPDTASIGVGETLQLTATVAPASANPAVTWSTSSDTTVSVTPEGLVTALEIGTATITATSVSTPSISASIEIEVNAYVSEMLTFVGMNGSSSEDTYAQQSDGTWSTEFINASVLNKSGSPDGTKADFIRQQQNYTLTIEPKNGAIVSEIRLIEYSDNKGSFSNLQLSNATGKSTSDGYTITPNDGTTEITSSYPSGSMLCYTMEISYRHAGVEMGDVTRLEITSAPTNTNYYVGETNDLTGLKIVGYDANGLSADLDWADEETIKVEPANGYVFREEDITSEEGTTAVVTYLPTNVSAEVTWNYVVEAAPSYIDYHPINTKVNLLIGTKVVIGAAHNGTYYLATNRNSDHLQTTTADRVTEDGGFSIYDNETEVTTFEIRIAGEGMIALYNEENGYLAANGSGDISYLNSVDSESSWRYEITGTAIEIYCGDRILAYNTSNSRIKGYSTSYGQGIAVKLFFVNQAAEDQAAELDRYLMEADTEYQCVDKFPVAKDAYLNLMNEEGRTAFASHMDAVTRYKAWATYLGELPYAEGQVQAYMPFAMNQNETGWIIAVAVLASCALLGGGYYFYRKRRTI